MSPSQGENREIVALLMTGIIKLSIQRRRMTRNTQMSFSRDDDYLIVLPDEISRCYSPVSKQETRSNEIGSPLVTAN